MTDLTLPVDADAAEHINDAALSVLEIVDQSSEPDEINDLRFRWEAFAALVTRRQRRSGARAQAVARMIELRLAEVLDGIPLPGWPDGVGRNEIAQIRQMYKYRDLVLEAIDRSTNAHPPTRHAVCEHIRHHRLEAGEVAPRSPEVRREARRLAHEELMADHEKHAKSRADQKERERAADARKMREIGSPKVETTYSLIRQALTNMSQAGVISRFVWDVERGLHLAEEAIVLLMAELSERAELDAIESRNTPVGASA